MVTVEAALSMLSLMVVAAAAVAACMTMAATIAATSMAGAAARAHAVGKDYAPARGTISVVESAGWVEVTAHIPVLIGKAKATARFPVEDKDQ
ncbi:MAG: hypothetical protein Q3962_08095 [Corynebacterium sp.]|nr:hypothetical protein [Corynebacterium sp.]